MYGFDFKKWQQNYNTKEGIKRRRFLNKMWGDTSPEGIAFRTENLSKLDALNEARKKELDIK